MLAVSMRTTKELHLLGEFTALPLDPLGELSPQAATPHTSTSNSAVNGANDERMTDSPSVTVVWRQAKVQLTLDQRWVTETGSGRRTSA